jgi:hypothetical protein
VPAPVQIQPPRIGIDLKRHRPSRLWYYSPGLASATIVLDCWKRQPPNRKLGFIDYDGDLKVRSSLLGVLLHD